MRIDWEKEGDVEYRVYPEGTYRIKITGYEETTASTGTKQIRWRGVVIAPQDHVNGPVTTHTALTEKSLWRLARLVKACGISLKEAGSMEVGSPAFFRVLDACKGRTTYWQMSKGVDNKGRERNEIDDFVVDDECEGTISNDDDAPSFVK